MSARINLPANTWETNRDTCPDPPARSNKPLEGKSLLDLLHIPK